MISIFDSNLLTTRSMLLLHLLHLLLISVAAINILESLHVNTVTEDLSHLTTLELTTVTASATESLGSFGVCWSKRNLLHIINLILNIIF